MISGCKVTHIICISSYQYKEKKYHYYGMLRAGPSTNPYFASLTAKKSLNHDLVTIADIDPLTRFSDTLTLEGIPCSFSLAFGKGRSEVRRSIILESKADKSGTSLSRSLQQRQIGTIGL